MCYRSRVEIQLALELAVNRYGTINSKMKSNHNCRILDVELSQWLIQVQIQTDHNCKILTTDLRSTIKFKKKTFFCSFITYRSCRHLDGKHTVFGKLVGGLDTLSELEKIEVDNKDRPIEDIVIQKAQAFVDPYQEADDQLMKERAAEIEKQQQLVLAEQKRKQKAKPLKVYREGIGKYLNTGSEIKSTPSETATSEPLPKIQKKGANGFGNFTSW